MMDQVPLRILFFMMISYANRLARINERSSAYLAVQANQLSPRPRKVSILL
jgi:hypothetical protein